MAASSDLYKIPMQEVLADRNLMQEMKVQVHYPAYIHRDSEKSSNLLIRYSARLTEEEERKKMNKMHGW